MVAAVILLVAIATNVLLLPIVVESTTRILPLGDSITLGCGDTCGYPAGSNCLTNKTLDCPSPFNVTCEAGYRKYLWRRLSESGYKVDFVGPFINGPADIDQHHAGYPGGFIGPTRYSHWFGLWFTLADCSFLHPSGNWDLLYYLPVWSSYKPDIILLMIGTNDVWAFLPGPTMVGMLNPDSSIAQ